MHLYLASIFSTLLSGSPRFQPYFFIRHLLPPYALYYDLLVALGHLVPSPWAEKLVACFIFAVTGYGFRFLTRALHGQDSGLASLFVIPLLFNWPFFMGFLNFSLSLGLALWAMGFWIHATAGPPRVFHWRLAYLCTLGLMAFTHPVPVVVVCAFVLLDLLWRAVGGPLRFPIAAGLERRAKPYADLATALVGCCTLFYIASFADKRLTGPLSQATDRSLILGKLLSLSFLSIFSGAHLATYLDRLGFYLIAAASLALAFRGFVHRWRHKETSPADTLFLCAGLLLLAIPLLPPDLNGQHFFTARLLIVLWMALLAAASASGLELAPRPRSVLAGVAVAAILGTLLLAHHRFAPVERLLADAEHAPLRALPPNAAGLLLTGNSAPGASDLSFDPYRWMGAVYFRRTGSTMIDAGFMDSPVIPVGAHLGLLTGAFSQSVLESTANSEALLHRSARFRNEILPYASFVVFPRGSAETLAPEQARQAQSDLYSLTVDQPVRHWTCAPEAVYVVCRAPGSQPLPATSPAPHR